MDKPTFEDLVTEYRGWIRRSLRRLGVGPSDLDDVTQVVLRGVARGLPMFDPSLAAVPELAVIAWLFGICRRQAVNHRRSMRRRRETLQDTREMDRLGGPSPSPVESLIESERRARLYKVLEDMEPQRRAVLVAYELEGIPMAEVAETLGIPVNTAWNRLRLARSDIKAAWESEDE